MHKNSGRKYFYLSYLNIHFESKTKDNGVGIYYFDDKKDDWIYLKTTYDNNKYSTSVLSNETFALIKDDKNPVITNLIPNINSTYRFQDLKMLSFNIEDELSGISDIKNIQVKIDGENILFDYIPYRKLVQYIFDEELLILTVFVRVILNGPCFFINSLIESQIEDTC